MHAPQPDPAPFNLAAHVLAAGSATPDKIALAILGTSGAERWSYARLEAAVRAAATGFASLGLPPGARILLRLSNSPAFPLAFLGAIAAGFVPVPTAAALTEVEVTRLSAAVGPALILADPGIALPEAHGVPLLSRAEFDRFAILPPCDFDLGDPERPAYVLFTSGTSGRPMGVVHAHRVIHARALMRDGWEGLRREDRLMHAGALNWSYTLGVGLLDPWLVGATALIPAPDISPAQLPLLIKRHDVSIFAAAPGIYRAMLRAPLPTLPRLRHGLSAGEKLPEALRQEWQRHTGTDLHEAIGMTECSTFLSGSPARPAPEGALGYPQPGRQVAVIGSDGQPLAPGHEGVLAIHRSDPGLMLGYLDAPADSRFAGEWFLTGDLVVEDAHGAFRLTGRADEMMNPGGFRLSPHEVEQALAGLPGITELAVTEVEVKPGVRVVGCFYVAEADHDAALATRAEASLAPWKRPRLYRRLPALPRNANAKINRRALAALPAPDAP